MIFNAMIEALVIFKILFDIALEIGKLLWNAVVALVSLICKAISNRSGSNNKDE